MRTKLTDFETNSTGNMGKSTIQKEKYRWSFICRPGTSVEIVIAEAVKYSSSTQNRKDGNRRRTVPNKFAGIGLLKIQTADTAVAKTSPNV